MKPTTGLVNAASMNAAASSSAVPPISPIMHDRLGRRIRGEQLQRVDERRADQRIAANADAGGLAEAQPRELVDRFVGERAALGDDADAALPCRCGPG